MTKYTEKNTPHPKGPRSERRKSNKKRCKRVKVVRGKVLNKIKEG